MALTRILHVVGARPNIMKIAPIMLELKNYAKEFEQQLVHTGQHFDENLSNIFFQDLEIPSPDVNLQVGSGSHAWQTAQVMLKIEPMLLDFQPHWVIVPGDVNSTLATALVASKLGIRVAHVEAGLRSFDPTMPEEINRILTDHIAELLFTTEASANDNLKREGIPQSKIHFVGNVMIDTLERLFPRAESRWHALSNRMRPAHYVLATFHRPANVDNLSNLSTIFSALIEISESYPVIFPIHPRTRHRLEENGMLSDSPNLHIVDPLGYIDFLALEAHADAVLTDSGGVQEETTYLGVPCVTVRPNTERPVTIKEGTNELVACDREAIIRRVVARVSSGKPSRTLPPALWDGQSAKRIVKVLQGFE